jgi:hypothetical protein
MDCSITPEITAVLMSAFNQVSVLSFIAGGFVGLIVAETVWRVGCIGLRFISRRLFRARKEVA